MKRLILIAIFDDKKNVVRFRSAPDSKIALQILTNAREQGFLTVAGTITYENSYDRARAQLKYRLKQKLLEKMRAKI